MISVQTEDFSLADEYQQLRNKLPERTGAIVTFSGLVRDYGDQDGVSSLELEHYEGMTQRSLQAIVDDASQRWDIIDTRIIHRVGRLELSDQIVFVGVSSAHRLAAFQACEFIMDYLKTSAPFWKKEITDDNATWVEAKQSDAAQVETWESKNTL